MPNDPSSISPKTHAVVAVRGIGNVAVPYGTPLNALHSAIVKHEDYSEPAAPIVPDEIKPLDTISTSVPNITAEGAIENSPQFKWAAKKAWDQTMTSNAAAFISRAPNSGNTEAGFSINRDGSTTPVESHMDEGEGGSLPQSNTANTQALFHTHPPVVGVNQEPSPNDIAIAKEIGKPIMVASKAGLFEALPDGSVVQVFKSADWMNQKKKK